MKVITITIVAQILFLFFLLFPGTCHASPINLPLQEQQTITEVANEYDLTGDARLLLFVIRKVEGGGKGIEFGVLNPRAINTTFKNQCQWAAGTIAKRYRGDLKKFAQRYCPVGAVNDPTGLNKNWYKNASYYMKEWQDDALCGIAGKK